MNDDIIKQLEKLHIYDIQITLDGPPRIHNVRRKLPNGEDTFFVILNNIKRLVTLSPNTNVSIRVNTDKQNIPYINEILDYLEDYGIRERVGLYLAPVDNVNNTCNGSLCFSNAEFAKEQIKFIKSNLKRGYNYINLPHTNIGICGAVAANNYVIDAVGDMYKCWDEVACPKQKLGNILDEQISYNKNLTKWVNYDIHKNQECMDCPYLPLCMGGCPNYSIKNKTKKCLPIKENSKDLIDLLYSLSQENQ